MPALLIQTISEIVISIVSSILYDAGKEGVAKAYHSAIDKARTKRINDVLSTKLSKLSSDDSTSVLDTSTFFDYLKYQNPEDKIKAHIVSHDGVSDQDIISSLVKDCVDSFSHSGHTCTSLEESTLRSFFSIIINAITSELDNARNAGQESLSHQENEHYADLSGQLSDISEQNSILEDKIVELTSILKNQRASVVDSVTAQEILHSILDVVISGKIYDAYQISKQLEGKNKDLDKGIKILFSVISDLESILDDEVLSLWKQIKDTGIKNSVSRVLLWIGAAEPDKNAEFLQELHNCLNSDVLKNITDAVIKGNIDSLIIESKVVDNAGDASDVVPRINLTIKDEYKAEKWLVTHLLVYYLDNSSIFNKSSAIIDFTANDINIIDKLYIWKNQIEELLRSHVENGINEVIEKAKTLKSDIEKDYSEYNHSNSEIHSCYYALMLRCACIIDEKNISSAIASVPEEFHTNRRIQPYIIQDQINNNAISEDEIFARSMELNRPDVLDSYLSRFSNDISRFIQSIESHPDCLGFNFAIYDQYIRALEFNGNFDKAVCILKRYEDTYKDYLPYWLEAYRNYFGRGDKENKDYAFKRMVSLEKSGIYYTTSIDNLIIYVDCLANEGDYEDAVEKIKLLNSIGIETPSMVEIKAFNLHKYNRDNEALKLLIDNFDLISNQPNCIDFIITYSINNKREISPKVVKAAVDIGTARLISLASICEYNSGDFGSAKVHAMQAMLRSKKDDEYLFDSLFTNFTGEEGGADKPEYTETGTFVVLREVEDENADCKQTITRETKKLEVCIYDNKILPSDKFVWKGAIHIYKDTSVKMDLFRRKTGDHVKVDGISYEISDIYPLDTFYFRTCTSSMVERNRAWEFHFTDAKQFLKDLVKTYEDNGWSSKSVDIKSFYQDFDAVPQTFWSLKKFYSLEYGEFVRFLLDDRRVITREMIIAPCRDFVDKCDVSVANRNDNDTDERFDEREDKRNTTNTEVISSFENSSGEKKELAKEYILTYPTANMLYKLGFKLNLVPNYKERIFVTQSSKYTAQQEKDTIFRSNNSKHVGGLKVENGQARIYESADEFKRKNISEAVSFKEFIDSFKAIDNAEDLVVEGINKEAKTELFGVCDYDALTIAHLHQKVLVTNEPLEQLATNINDLSSECMGIEDFLCNIDYPFDELMDILQKMFDFRYQFVLTPTVILYISDKFATAVRNGNKDEQKHIIEACGDLLLKPQDLDCGYTDIYRKMCIESLRRLPKEKVQVDNPIISNFIHSVMYYNKLVIEYFIDKGTLYYRLAKEEEKSDKAAGVNPE